MGRHIVRSEDAFSFTEGNLTAQRYIDVILQPDVVPLVGETKSLAA